MLFDSKEFNAMQSSIDALWMKQKAISHNIANYETPGFKTSSVQFEDVLKGAQDGSYDFRATVTTNDQTSLRPDGNNVDMEKESLELYQTYAQSSYLYQKIGGQFTNLRYVLNQTVK